MGCLIKFTRKGTDGSPKSLNFGVFINYQGLLFN